MHVQIEASSLIAGTWDAAPTNRKGIWSESCKARELRPYQKAVGQGAMCSRPVDEVLAQGFTPAT